MSVSKIEEEKNLLAVMVGIYCRKKEKNPVICTDCRELIEYAQARLDRCPFGEAKPACKKCPIHCYNPLMKERVKKVMRYAGPRMLLVSPGVALRHYLCVTFRFPSRKGENKI